MVLILYIADYDLELEKDRLAGRLEQEVRVYAEAA
jgi:hypothetical protein